MRFSSLDRGHRELPHWLSLLMDVGLYAVSIEKLQPIEGGRDVKFNILALVQYLDNLVRAAPDNIEFPFMSIFRYQHPPSFTDFRHLNVSLHLQDHMHLASTFLGKHCTHRTQGTFRSLHVIIHGRLLMCMRSHSGKIQWNSIHSNCRTTASRHMLGAQKEREAPRRKEAREVCSLAGNLQE